MSGLNKNLQLGKSFPGNNKKNIDYVIKYREKTNVNSKEHGKQLNIQELRKAFFKCLENEDFDIYYIRLKRSNYVKVYALLNCSVDRLLREAEAVKLQMRLKTVISIFFFLNIN